MGDLAVVAKHKQVKLPVKQTGPFAGVGEERHEEAAIGGRPALVVRDRAGAGKPPKSNDGGESDERADRGQLERNCVGSDKREDRPPSLTLPHKAGGNRMGKRFGGQSRKIVCAFGQWKVSGLGAHLSADDSPPYG